MPTLTRLDSLLAQVRVLTLERGKRSQLAVFLGISRQQLNHWISGARAPGGEVTLQLLEWVTAEAAKQKSVSSVQAPPTPKTRQKKVIKHENKPQSSRRKK